MRCNCIEWEILAVAFAVLTVKGDDEVGEEEIECGGYDSWDEDGLWWFVSILRQRCVVLITLTLTTSMKPVIVTLKSGLTGLPYRSIVARFVYEALEL